MPVPKDFKQVGPIGEGYFCTVSKYKSITRNKEYAIKTLKTEHQQNADYRNRFLREISLLKDLAENPYVIDLIDHEPNESEPQLWYAMSLASENLYRFIKKHNQKLDREYRITLFEHVLSAIDYAHSQSIVHRDIGPSNVLIFEEAEGVYCKLSDFGLGKDSDAVNYTRTSMGGFGQALYMAPEQRDHLKDADTRSDIYALGKLLYFIMNGKDPADIRGGDFNTVIRRSIQENPRDRYQSIEELNKEFQSIKKFLLSPGIPIEKKTIKDYLSDKNGNINWNEFHELALKANFESDEYDDFIWPITACLLDKKNLDAYHAAKKGDFIHFVEKYNDAIDELTRGVGWPFSSMDSFGILNSLIVRTSNDNDVKLRCLCQIWRLAWDLNQFSVQNNFRNILNENLVTPEIESQLAEFMISNSNSRGEGAAHFLGSRVPPLIRKAVNQLTKEK